MIKKITTERLIKILAFGILGVMGVFCLYFSLTPYRHCDIQYLTRTTSPNRKLEASTYLVDCDIGFGQDNSFFSVLLRISKDGTKFHQDDQIVYIDNDDYSINISTTWVDDNNLKIDIPEKARLSSTLWEHLGVNIAYERRKQ